MPASILQETTMKTKTSVLALAALALASATALVPSSASAWGHRGGGFHAGPARHIGGWNHGGALWHPVTRPHWGPHFRPHWGPHFGPNFVHRPYLVYPRPLAPLYRPAYVPVAVPSRPATTYVTPAALV